MGSDNKAQRIGKALRAACLGAVLAVGSIAAHAGEVQFSADVNPPEVSQDESVSLRLKVTSDSSIRINNVDFNAPDFDVVNEYSSTFSNSYYDNGRFGMTVTQTVTKVLRPRRNGDLVISGLRALAGNKTYSAPDIHVHVSPAGAGTPPPRNYGGGGVGLRGAGKRVSSQSFLVRAELSKERAYKGEQVIVSYYLYRRVPIVNIQVTTFPELKGLLREEMEMPVMGTRLDSERVMLDGVPYDRSLLVRYAAYPLQEGKLRIDPIGLKFAYRPSSGRGMDDNEDPFFQFFGQMQLREATSRSESLMVEVLPLPQDNRPSSFSGGVGDFNVSSAVDKYDVRANEAVNLTFKIEGQGNMAAIGEPKAKWPDGVELYDSKGSSNSGKGGLGSKVFEYVLIPRTPGKLTLPPMEFSYFDPAKKNYVTKSTDKIDITVSEAAPGSSVAQPQRANGAPVGKGTSTPKASDDLRYLKAPSASLINEGIWNWLYALSMTGSLFALGWLGFDTIKRRRGVAVAGSSGGSRLRFDAKAWDGLRAEARRAMDQRTDFKDVSGAYERLSSLVIEAIDQATGVGARSLPRSELRRLLADDHQIQGSLCDRIVQLLEFAETVRFASQLGAVSEQSARSKIESCVNEAESVVQALGQALGQMPKQAMRN